MSKIDLSEKEDCIQNSVDSEKVKDLYPEPGGRRSRLFCFFNYDRFGNYYRFLSLFKDSLSIILVRILDRDP